MSEVLRTCHSLKLRVTFSIVGENEFQKSPVGEV